ncbi:hypothetical protein HK100_011502 [Physocladia obscura]|uniref:Uncharacterized protein n=1 Tax=Physocladia obscura TaxID=109957 RepID=A0AAD5TB59_9FUNG|nr:hypothetical protein HK100_011502 [Physocladia obscura]
MLGHSTIDDVFTQQQHDRLNSINQALTATRVRERAGLEAERRELLHLKLKAKNAAERRLKNKLTISNLSAPSSLQANVVDTEQLKAMNNRPNGNRSSKTGNGTAYHYQKLREHYARKKARPAATVSLINWLLQQDGNLRKMLEANAVGILLDDVVIWDTESDGVGGTHDLELTRDWVLTNETLHINREEPAIEERIIDFVRPSRLIAFESKGCDRNRLEHLHKAYSALNGQFVDFRRDIFNSIFTTDQTRNSHLYLTGGMQDDIWQISGVQELDNEEKNAMGLIDIPVLTNDKSNKCEVDIRVLTNLFLLLRFFVEVENELEEQKE